jgi:hypothetical protein
MIFIYSPRMFLFNCTIVLSDPFVRGSGCVQKWHGSGTLVLKVKKSADAFCKRLKRPPVRCVHMSWCALHCTGWSLCVPAPLCHRCCVVSAKQQPLNCTVIAKLHPSPPLYSEGLGTRMTRLFILLQEKTKRKTTEPCSKSCSSVCVHGRLRLYNFFISRY